MDSAMLMSYELSPVPVSMFDQHGKMRIATDISTLLNALKVQSPTRRLNDADATFLDGCAILWVISWPIGTATECVENTYTDDHMDSCSGCQSSWPGINTIWMVNRQRFHIPCPSYRT